MPDSVKNVLLAVLGIIVLAGVVVALRSGGGSPSDASALPSPSPLASPSPDPGLLAVLGDSYASGSGEGGARAAGWPALLSSRHHMTLNLNGQGGTGYTVATLPNTVPYPDRVSDFIASSVGAKIVIVEGSRNDTDPTKVRAVAPSVLSKIKAGLPRAKVFVIGPIWSDTAVPPSVQAVDDAVKAAARGLGLPFVDAIAEGWFSGQTDLIGKDRVHPTDAGHQRLATLIDVDLARLGAYRSSSQ